MSNALQKRKWDYSSVLSSKTARTGEKFPKIFRLRATSSDLLLNTLSILVLGVLRRWRSVGQRLLLSRTWIGTTTAVMASLADISTSRIWNRDETGMCPQTRNSKKKVLAATNMRANVQESNDRTNVSVLVCVNADGGYVLPFFMLPGKKIRVRDTAGGMKGSTFAASESAFLTTKLFIQVFLHTDPY
ncbi:TRAF3-interacting protein [Phytophthora megakarya]|uniref:TRAF3-interacting protein n=1 Tax=Phytophthora megakarya TaxID=4795 RepID=A0A225VCS3_9STRA|nr:TRAF3-interacting protein [Phytophthora megakarya]